MKLTKLDIVALVITLAALAAMTLTSPSFRRSTEGEAVVVVTARTAPDDGAGNAPPSSSPSPAQDQVQEDAGDTVRFPLDLNTATAEELETLPGIGAVRAQAIVDYRTEHGPFTYVEDLRAVSGIGEGTLEKLMDYITVGEREHG